MFETGYFLVHMALASVTVWITWKYLSIIFKPKKQAVVSLLWILFYGFQVWTEGQQSIDFIWILVINISIQFLITALGYEGALLKKFFYIFLMFIMWTLVEMFVYFILRLIPMDYQQFSVLGSVISKLAAVMLINSLRLWFQKKYSETVSGYYMLVLFLFPAASIMIAHNIFVLDNKQELNFFSLLSFSLLLMINLFIFEVYNKLSMNYSLEKENSMFQQQIDLLTVHNEEQQRAHDEIARMRHDMKNQLLVLQHEAVSGETQSIIQTIDGMLDRAEQRKSSHMQSGNDLIDAIISSKCSIAEERGIHFEYKLFVPSTLPMQQGDLGILIGNALDNAIEATQKCGEDKLIKISMGIKKNALVVIIENPYIQEPIVDSYGRYLTTKEQKENHGYGLKSIKKIVERYDGDLDISTENHVFSLIATLNFNSII